MPNNWPAYPDDPTHFGKRGVVVTPSNSADLAEIPKSIVVLSAGDVSVIPLRNSDVATINFAGAPAGFLIPFLVRRVMATGTTATVAAIYD